jgi:hypothetical protein
MINGNFKIELTNICGHTTKINTDLSSCSYREEIEKIINNFLNLCGYSDYNKDRVILTSVSNEEYDMVMDFLDNLRTNNKNELPPHWELESDKEEPNPLFKLVKCSKCSKPHNALSKYCPNCGTRMYSGREMLGGLSNDNEVERY